MGQVLIDIPVIEYLSLTSLALSSLQVSEVWAAAYRMPVVVLLGD